MSENCSRSDAFRDESNTRIACQNSMTGMGHESAVAIISPNSAKRRQEVVRHAVRSRRGAGPLAISEVG
jgi:hypothetical protein